MVSIERSGCSEDLKIESVAKRATEAGLTEAAAYFTDAVEVVADTAVAENDFKVEHNFGMYGVGFC